MTQPAASGPDQFDPAAFTVVEPKAFEDLKVGDIFRAPSRTLTDAHTTAFQAVSANNHPGHDRQPAWPAGPRRRAHLPAQDRAAEPTAGCVMSFTRADYLLGAWRLDSAVEVFDDGERRDEFGPSPEGYLCYTPGGIVSATLGDLARHRSRPATRKAAPTPTTKKWPGTSSPTPGHSAPIPAPGPSPITSTARCSRTGKATTKSGTSPSRASG